jgi:hypothetical protein
MRIVVLIGVVVTRLPWPSTAQQVDPVVGPYDRLLIRGVTLIDGTGSPPVGPLDLVIERNWITEVRRVTRLNLASGARRATGEKVIEAEGMYVMPGLIDAHTHLGRASGFSPEYILKLWLAHGVTTVRVFAGGEDDPAVQIARDQRAGKSLEAPRLVLYRFWRGSDPRLWTPEGAREVVRQWKDRGVDGIKMSGKPGLFPDLLRAIADEAGKLGMGVAVHIGQDGVVPMNAVQVAAAGVTTIEHHYGYAAATFTDRTVQALEPDYNYGDELQRFRATGRVWDEADLGRLYGDVLDTLVALSKNGRFTMVPTFSVYEDRTDLSRAKTLPWLEPYAVPFLLARWRPTAEVHGSFYSEWTSADEAVWGRLFIGWLPWVNAFKNRGGHVAVGSDAGTSYYLYGFGSIREWELLQRPGFHPWRWCALLPSRAPGPWG